MGKSWQTNEYKSTKHALKIVAAVNTDTETERESERERETERERERERGRQHHQHARQQRQNPGHNRRGALKHCRWLLRISTFGHQNLKLGPLMDECRGGKSRRRDSGSCT